MWCHYRKAIVAIFLLAACAPAANEQELSLRPQSAGSASTPQSAHAEAREIEKSIPPEAPSPISCDGFDAAAITSVLKDYEEVWPDGVQLANDLIHDPGFTAGRGCGGKFVAAGDSRHDPPGIDVVYLVGADEVTPDNMREHCYFEECTDGAENYVHGRDQSDYQLWCWDGAPPLRLVRLGTRGGLELAVEKMAAMCNDLLRAHPA